jgi:4-alpha-glucanotransferase
MSSSYITFQPSSSYEDALSRAASENRVAREYWDIFHKRHEVSHEVEKGILAALGWDVSSRESIDRSRAARFREELTQVLPVTAVLSEHDKSVLIAFPAGKGGAVCFDVNLEDGQQISGSLDLSQLEWVNDVSIDNARWARFKLRLPAEVPLGYHKLRVTLGGNQGACHLIVCPDRTYLPDHLANGGRSAGFNITLYGLRSNRNWGCGDFTDLRALADWAHKQVGFSFIGLNPLHALHNRVPYNTSPYLPLSQFYKNLLYIDIEKVDDFKHCACAQNLLASPKIQNWLRTVRDSEFVPYQEIDRVKRRFLKMLFRQFQRTRAGNPERAHAFGDFCRQEGDLLDKFALYRALDEVLHKRDRNRWTWQQWPSEYQHPDSEACRRFAEQHPQTITFYKYVQFVLHEQLTAAQEYVKQHGLSVGLYHDLALATDSCGADLWAYRDFYVSGCRVGAPPDDFSPHGQDWAFPPPNSEAHRHSGYYLYRESIRKIVRYGGALRIDHVMRLIRLFWIPAFATPAEGAYVQDYAVDLMRILALESVRAKALVIGEDLGTVTDEMREMFSRFGILSYRLFYFEKHRNGCFKRSWEYPREALVSSSTHDLATMCGFWTARDIEARKAAGLADDYGYRSQCEDRNREKQKMLDTLHAEHLLPDTYPRDVALVPEVDGTLHNAIIGFLASVPSMLLLLNQEDLTKETDQQNLPGSTSAYPNWQRRMKVKIEELSEPRWQPFASMFRHQLERTQRL